MRDNYSSMIAKKSEVVTYLEQIAAIQSEGDNDVAEVRIAKLGDGIYHSKELNHHKKQTVGEFLKARDWNALKKYLENI
ncbi:MAG: hypothetical protein LBU24_00675 [Methanocalculaceae archaeon]|nr:hypothetical protein [Methanocalculaceae archaeon]